MRHGPAQSFFFQSYLQKIWIFMLMQICKDQLIKGCNEIICYIIDKSITA